MPTATLVHCACEHCQCDFAEDQGYRYQGLLYCSEACAHHDHEHPSECCQSHSCCH